MSRWDDDGFRAPNVRMWTTDLRGLLMGCGCFLLLALLLLFVISWTLVRVIPTLALVVLIVGVVLILVMRPRR